MKYIAYTSSSSPSLLRKTVALVATFAVAGAVLMFSAVVLAVMLILGLIAAAYLWWKTRELRKMMKSFQPRAANDGEAFRAETFREESLKGEIIEGEATRVHEPRDGKA